MITEDYVSFEIAKLLKEKGFDCSCEYQYINCSSGHPFLTDIRDDSGCYYKNSEIGQDEYSAPTQSMAMKWLREVHNIFIEISVDEMLKDEGYQWALYYNSTKEIRPYSGWGDSYEEACEAAIKYCLENLITPSSISEQ